MVLTLHYDPDILTCGYFLQQASRMTNADRGPTGTKETEEKVPDTREVPPDPACPTRRMGEAEVEEAAEGVEEMEVDGGGVTKMVVEEGNDQTSPGNHIRAEARAVEVTILPGGPVGVLILFLMSRFRAKSPHLQLEFPLHRTVWQQ